MIYAGLTDLAQNYSDLTVPGEFQDALKEATERTSFEMHRSFINNDKFRRDVYFKPMPASEQDKNKSKNKDNHDPKYDFMEHFAYVLMVNPAQFKFELQTPLGLMKFQGRFFKPLVETLAKGPMTLAQLMANELTDVDRETLCDALQKLIITGQVQLMSANRIRKQDAAEVDAGTQISSKLGVTLLQNQQMDEKKMYVPAVRMGSPVSISRNNAISLRMLSGDEQQVIEEVMEQLQQKGMVLQDHNKETISDPDKQGAFLRGNAERFEKQVLPVFMNLGVLG